MNTPLVSVTGVSPVASPASSITAQQLPVFSQGEILEGFVLKTWGSERALLSIKDVRVSADTSATLQVGDRLALRVEQTSPRVLLQILPDTAVESNRVNSYLSLFRANPRMVEDLFANLQKLAASLLPEEAPLSDLAKSSEALSRTLEGLAYGKGQVGQPQYLKDYLQGLGLLLESGLMKTVMGKSPERGQVAGGDLKTALLNLSAKLEAMLADSTDLTAETRQVLEQARRQVETGLKSLESLQVMNVQSRENGGPLMFQIPFLFPGGLVQQDLYIEVDRQAKGEGTSSVTPSCRCILFLELDVLGDVMVDARLAGKSVGGVLKCAREETRAFLASFLPDLADRLSASGFDLREFNCLLDPRVREERAAFRSEQQTYAGDALSVFV